MEKVSRKGFLAMAGIAALCPALATAGEVSGKASLDEVTLEFPEGWEVTEGDGSIAVKSPDGAVYTLKVTRPAALDGVSSYGPGNYVVGSDIPAGEYVFVANGERAAYVCSYDDVARSKICMNERFETQAIMAVIDGQLLELDRADAVPFDEYPHELADVRGEGTWKVGADLPAGTYALAQVGDRAAYWCIYDGAGPGRGIVKNNRFEGSDYAVVEDGQYLALNRCEAVLQQ